MNFYSVLTLLYLCTGTVLGKEKEKVYFRTYCPPGATGGPPDFKPEGLTVLGFKVVGCNQEPCVMIKGKTYTVTSTFSYNYTATSMPYTIGAVTAVGVVTVFFGNFCEYVVNGSCKNIRPGTQLEIKMVRKIEYWFPNLDGWYRLIIKDSEYNPRYCGELHLRIEDPPIKEILGGLL